MTWIVADPEHLGGKPRVAGTRISVAFLLESLAAGMTIPEIVHAYPTLTEEAVRGTLAELAKSKELAASREPSSMRTSRRVIGSLRLKGLENSRLYREIASQYDLFFTKDREFADRIGRLAAPAPVSVVLTTIAQRPEAEFVAEFMSTPRPVREWPGPG